MGSIISTEIRKVLVMGLTGIGNLILFSPAARQLKKNCAGIEITLLTFSQNGDLSIFLYNNLVDKIIYLDKSADRNILFRYIDYLSIIFILRRRKFDLSILPFSGGANLKFRVVSFLFGAKKRVLHIKKKSWLDGFINIDVLPQIIHDINQNINLLRELDINDKTVDYRIDVAKEEREWAEDKLATDRAFGLLIGIQPCVKRSFDPTRQWPAENFLQLCDLLHERFNSFIYLFGNNEELDVLEAISKSVKSNVKTVVGLPLHKVSALIQRMDCFAANDSGLMHMAAAVGVPTLGIFGPTNPVRTSPYGVKNAIVRSGEAVSRRYLLSGQVSEKLKDSRLNLNQLSPEIILQELEKLIGEKLRHRYSKTKL